MSKVRTSIFLVVLGVLGYMSIRHHYEVQGLLLLVAQQQQQLLEQTIAKGTDTLDNSSAAATASPSPVKDASTQSLWAALLRLPPLGLGIGQIPPVIPGFLSSDQGDIISSIASPLLALLHITTKTWSPSEMLSSPWGIVVILLLGFLLGILFSETPFVDPILRLLGLADSRRFGVDILQGTAWTFVDHPTQGSKRGAAAGAYDSGSGIGDEVRQTEDGHHTTETMASISPSLSTSSLLNEDRKAEQPLKPLGFQKTNYGLKYSFLNVEVTGGWLGMGLWPKDGTKIPYREACQAMVRKVTAGLNIDATSHLLDVGFGCGDQTVYMAELYGPKRITGITIEPLQHYAGEQLVLNSRNRTPNTSIELYVADASNLQDFLKEHSQVLGSSPGNGQSLLPSSLSTQRYFTHIISIDSAYHYNTRRKFFEQAYAVLEPGRGLLAMADVIPRRRPPMTGIKGWIFRQFSRWYLKVPLENMQTLEEYRQMLEEVGFQEIEIETVEDQVFLGWADFISTQLRVLKSVGLVRPRVGWSFWLLQNVLRSVDRSKTMHFIIVKARRRD
ncbi:hypothetical protein BGW42_007552 [Actinomortierella wolfii]|nr:hypothetical protein BGW42_007552 [Actinomortierella wolfii]